MPADDDNQNVIIEPPLAYSKPRFCELADVDEAFVDKAIRTGALKCTEVGPGRFVIKYQDAVDFLARLPRATKPRRRNQSRPKARRA